MPFILPHHSPHPPSPSNFMTFTQYCAAGASMGSATVNFMRIFRHCLRVSNSIIARRRGEVIASRMRGGAGEKEEGKGNHLPSTSATQLSFVRHGHSVPLTQAPALG
jgi:hypothetical protein